jgi:large subunit ribosomal protein L6
MAKKEFQETIKAPEGISFTKEGTNVLIKGPKGVVKRDFSNPSVKVSVTGNEITLATQTTSKKVKAVVFSYKAHLRNAFLGVKEGYNYKMKICSGHFPMNVSVAGSTLIIKNFLGEKVPRQVKLKQGVTVKVDGANILIDGVDKEIAGQVAADIEQSTKRPAFDRRIFQDGIYIIEKAGKAI